MHKKIRSVTGGAHERMVEEIHGPYKGFVG